MQANNFLRILIRESLELTDSFAYLLDVDIKGDIAIFRRCSRQPERVVAPQYFVTRAELMHITPVSEPYPPIWTIAYNGEDIPMVDMELSKAEKEHASKMIPVPTSAYDYLLRRGTTALIRSERGIDSWSRANVNKQELVRNI